jgi:hypothetical protein
MISVCVPNIQEGYLGDLIQQGVGPFATTNRFGKIISKLIF